MNKLGKIASACVLAAGLLLAVAANAGGYEPVSNAASADYFGGAFVGVTGVAEGRADNIRFSEPQDLAAARGSLRIIGGLNGGGGGFFMGYGMSFSSFYAGLQGYGQYIGGDNKVGGELPADQHIKALKNRWTWGGGVKLGYIMTPQSMFYFVFSGQNTKFDVVAYARNGTTKLTMGKSSSAFVPGLGMQVALTENWLVNAQYSYSIYGKMDKTNTDLTVSIYPRRTDFTFGVAYQFQAF